MSISRVSKAVAQIVKAGNFKDAENLRSQDIDLIFKTGSPQTIIMARAATALALRCFTGRIRIHSDTLNSDERSRLHATVVKEATIYGQPDRIDLSPGAVGAYRLGVNTTIPENACATASGWIAGINCCAGPEMPLVTPAAIFAVSVAMAKLFGAATLKETRYLKEAIKLSLWDLSDAGQPTSDVSSISLQGPLQIDLIGAGAIGSAFAFVLASLQYSATLRIFDFDIYEDPNQETTMFLGVKHVQKFPAKAVHLSKMLAGTSVGATPIQTKIADATQLTPKAIVVCAVDNAETRRVLDEAAGEGLLLNGAVGGTALDAGWVLWSRHGSGDPPLSQYYPKDSEEAHLSEAHTPADMTVDECTRMNYHDVSLAIPFVAVVAGSLLVAACEHRRMGHTILANKLTFDLLRKVSKFSASKIPLCA